MAPIDAITFAERSRDIERHLRRVHDRLPADAAALSPMSDATDAVILHLWQAVQTVIDIATSLTVARGLGVPATYGDAFRKLADDGVIDPTLAQRLGNAAGFRNLIVHAYADLDLELVHEIAQQGPDDLRSFLTAVRPSV